VWAIQGSQVIIQLDDESEEDERLIALRSAVLLDVSDS
jgi:hypothetical protein